jgi:hypothetical protein
MNDLIMEAFYWERAPRSPAVMKRGEPARRNPPGGRLLLDPGIPGRWERSDAFARGRLPVAAA